LAQYGYVLDDLAQTPAASRPAKAETWARIIVGKSESSSLAELLGITLPVSRQLAPHCVSKAHASALEEVGLVTADDILQLPVPKLMGVLSKSVEATVLAVTAALGAAASEPFKAPKPLEREHSHPEISVPDHPELERRLVREWARQKGYQISERGRLPTQLIHDYLESLSENAPDSKKSGNSPLAAQEDAPDSLTRQAIREWARQKGYTIGRRGRLPAWLVDAYNREKAASATPPEVTAEKTKPMDADDFLDFLKDM
jgi:hypothetical protein